MPIEDRNLEPGTVLTARYKKAERTCEVVQTDDGVRFRLDDGREFTSPSSAGKAAMGGVACNGWRFWSLAGTEKPKREPKATAAAKKPATKKAAKKSAKAKRKKSAKAHSERSRESYGCGACGETFGTQKAAVDHAMTHTTA